jgi:DNA-binding transcriptional regulator YiaG
MTPDELKQARAALGMTQAQLAQELEVSEDAVRGWETGRRPIRKTVATTVLHLLHCPPITD